jgi:hypothetical protein
VFPPLGPPFDLLLLKQLVLEDESVHVGWQAKSLLLLLAGYEREKVGVLSVEEVVDLASLGDKSGEGTLDVTFLTCRYS